MTDESLRDLARVKALAKDAGVTGPQGLTDSLALRWGLAQATRVPDLERELQRMRAPTSTPGARLRRAREAAGWTQGQLARHLLMARSSVANAEHGDRPLGGRLLAWVVEQESRR